MFNIKNHANNLQYSQRFYYSKYEFYNDYDKAEDFPNDITKIFYNCHRKTVPVITRYHRTGIAFPLTEDDRKIYGFMRNKQGVMQQSEEESMTMEEFLDGFIKIFQQNNYSDFADGAVQDRKNLFKISNFPSETFVRQMSLSAQRKGKLIKSLTSLQVISTLLDIQKQIFKNVMQLNENQQIHNQDLDYFRYKLAYSQLFYRSLYTTLRNKKQGKMTIHNFNLFRTLIQQILSNIINTQSCSHQILYIPNIPIMNYFINPALCIIKNFIVKQQSYSKSESSSNYQDFQREIPKIAFINLDGVQSPVNLEFLRNSASNSLLYVTVYKEYQYQSQSNNQIGMFYSRFLARLILDCNLQNSKSAEKNEQYNIFRPSKVLAFPLNSTYIKSQNPKLSCTLQGTSSDILFLFQSCIYEQLRLFGPNIIFISYGGKLVLQQQQFNQIIRKLTVISDHRIVLFANLCPLFTHNNYLREAMEQSQKQKQQKYQQSMQMGQQMSGERERDQSGFNFAAEYQDLENLSQFLQDYLICGGNIEQNVGFDVGLYFNNLAMFNKIVSGAYSFEQKREVKPSDKFSIGKRYQYLQTLSKMKKFAYLGKYCSKNANGIALQKLLNMQRDAFLNMNKQQSQFFSKFIDNAIQILLNNEAELPSHLKYKLQRLQLSLQSNKNELSQYLKQKKKNMLIQSISRPKTQKFFTLPYRQSRQLKHRDIMCLQFYLVDNFTLKNRQKVLLDSFTQVIIDRKTGIIFCLNYLDCRFHMCWLYGKISENKRQVQLRVLKKINSLQQKVFYFEFSYLFSNGGEKLYLYWPTQWNCIQQAAHNLLSLQYNPAKCHRVIIIQYNKQQFLTKVPSIIQLNSASQMSTIPRRGSSMYQKSKDQLYIFGGFYMNLHDFSIKQQVMGTGVTKMIIDYQKRQFLLEDISKSALRCRLRPKAGYSIKPIDNGQKLLLEGGYGRQFTNYYNIYSYIRYTFNLNTHELTSQKTHRYINSLQSPLRSPSIHSNSSLSPSKSLQSQSNKSQQQSLNSPTLASPYLKSNLKHKFLLAANSDSPLSFVNDEYMVSTHRQHNRTGIFQINSNIRCISSSILNSPQFYITQTNKNNNHNNNIKRIQILSPSSFTPSPSPQPSSLTACDIIMKQWMMPSQDAIISMCYDASDGVLYMLASDIVNDNVGIYRAQINTLTNNNNNTNSEQQNKQQIYNWSALQYKQHKKHSSTINSQILFNPYYFLMSSINQQHNYINFNNKTIYKLGSKLLIIGGQAILKNQCKQNNSKQYYYYHQREDYIIEQLRGVITVSKIICSIQTKNADDSNTSILNSHHPYIVRQPNSLNQINNSIIYTYYIQYSTQNSAYQLLIHSYNIYQKHHRITVSSLTVCLLQHNSLLQISVMPNQPIITAIHPYKCIIKIRAVLVDQYQRVVQIMKYIVKRQSQCGYADQYQYDLHKIIDQIGSILVTKQAEICKNQLDQLYQRVRQFGIYVCSHRQHKYYDYSQLKHSINQLLTLTLTCIIQQILLKLIDQPYQKQLYRFYLQDRLSPQSKYIAICQLSTNNIIFLRIKFTSKISIPIPTNSTQYLNNNQVLYCTNLVTQSLNSIIYCNQDYTKYYCNNYNQQQNMQEGIDVQEITPYQQEVQEYVVNVRIQAQYQQQSNHIKQQQNSSNLIQLNIKS